MIGQSTPYCAVLTSPWPSEPPLPLVSKPDTLHTPVCPVCKIKTPPTPKIVDCARESFSTTPAPVLETPANAQDSDPLSETPTTQLSPLRFDSPHSESTRIADSSPESAEPKKPTGTSEPAEKPTKSKKPAPSSESAQKSVESKKPSSSSELAKKSTEFKNSTASKSPKTQYVIPAITSKEKQLRAMTSTTSPRPITIASFKADTGKWKAKPAIPIRGTTAFVLRKQFHTYCGKRKYKSPPRKQVDFKGSPKFPIRQTKGTNLRKNKNKEKVKEILQNEDKKRPFR